MGILDIIKKKPYLAWAVYLKTVDRKRVNYKPEIKNYFDIFFQKNA